MKMRLAAMAFGLAMGLASHAENLESSARADVELDALLSGIKQ